MPDRRRRVTGEREQVDAAVACPKPASPTPKYIVTSWNDFERSHPPASRDLVDASRQDGSLPAIPPRPRFVGQFADVSGRTTYLWAYPVAIANQEPHPVRLIGRKVIVSQPGMTERVAAFRNPWLPAVGAILPVIQPGGVYSYTAGICTDGPEAPTLELRVRSRALDAEAIEELALPEIVFPQPAGQISVVDCQGKKLTLADQVKLERAVATYNAQASAGSAEFRTAAIGLTPQGLQIVNAFLFAEGRANRAKEREFDFKPICRTGVNVVKLKSADHFILFKNVENYKDIAISVVLFYNYKMHAIEKYNKISYLVEQFRSVGRAAGATEEEVRQACSIIMNAGPDHGNWEASSTAVARPDDEAGLVSASDFAPSTAKPVPEKAPALWSERTEEDEITAVNFIKKHYGEWIGKGLVLADIKRLDRPLYQAYGTRVSRHPDERLDLKTRSEIVDALASKHEQAVSSDGVVVGPMAVKEVASLSNALKVRASRLKVRISN